MHSAFTPGRFIFFLGVTGGGVRGAGVSFRGAIADRGGLPKCPPDSVSDSDPPAELSLPSLSISTAFGKFHLGGVLTTSREKNSSFPGLEQNPLRGGVPGER